MSDDIFQTATSFAEPTGPRELAIDVIKRATKKLGPPRDCGPLPVVVSPHMTGTLHGTGWALVPRLDAVDHAHPTTLMCSDEYWRELQLKLRGGVVDLDWFRGRGGEE